MPPKKSQPSPLYTVYLYYYNIHNKPMHTYYLLNTINDGTILNPSDKGFRILIKNKLTVKLDCNSTPIFIIYMNDNYDLFDIKMIQNKVFIFLKNANNNDAIHWEVDKFTVVASTLDKHVKNLTKSDIKW
jgi:hypothetical protein